ncbi:helix-turn-helix domain-containing protein [Streptomyces omiyaensis]|uniref:helix-turn-helix domain-containing protein n=1 Tax=Streptomyces omiyaensis TaxID=68247 RepID=UPI0036F6B99D
MTQPSPADELQVIVRTALHDKGISQAEAARQLGLSTKHMGHMLTGRAPLALDWAERLLALCGKRLTVRAVAARNHRGRAVTGRQP